MQAYANKSKQSNVRYFSVKTFPALGAASLTVRFADKWVYIYHTRLLPLSTVQHMIALAQAGWPASADGGGDGGVFGPGVILPPVLVIAARLPSRNDCFMPSPALRSGEVAAPTAASPTAAMPEPTAAAPDLPAEPSA